MAKTVADCALAAAVMAGEAPAALTAAPVAGLRLGIPRGLLLEGLDSHVAKAFEAALAGLGKAGASLSDQTLAPLLDEMAAVNAKGGFAAAESFQLHRAWMDSRAGDFDPREIG